MGALGLAVGGWCAIGAEFARENKTNFDFDSETGKFWCKLVSCTVHLKLV